MVRAVRGVQGPQKSESFPQQSIPFPSLSSSSQWLLAYFFFNLGLTIYNKVVLLNNFPFPYTLTAIHALSGTIGSYVCLLQGFFSAANLTTRETIHIILFSLLYTVNIVVSNVSLYFPHLRSDSHDRHLVTVPFHQIVRSTTPLFVIGISALFLQKTYPSQIYLSLLPVTSALRVTHARS